MAKRTGNDKNGSTSGVSLVELSVYVLAYRQEFARMNTKSIVTATAGMTKNNMVDCDKFRYEVIDNMKLWEREFAAILKRSKRLRNLTAEIKGSV